MCSGTEKSNRVSWVEQDVSTDHEIEGFIGRKGFNRRLFKADLRPIGGAAALA
jgi:hypothetical protein